MAIYQFYLAVVPKKGLLIKHEQVPDKIIVKIEDGYLYSMIEEYWILSEVEPNEIIHEIDQILNRGDLGDNEYLFNWKTCTFKVDNDAALSINAATGKIEELIFRADLREKDLKFLREIIKMAKKCNWLFMDKRGNLANPEMKEIKQLIKTSDNHKFLLNPLKFINDTGKGKKTE